MTARRTCSLALACSQMSRTNSCLNSSSVTGTGLFVRRLNACGCFLNTSKMNSHSDSLFGSGGGGVGLATVGVDGAAAFDDDDDVVVVGVGVVDEEEEEVDCFC